MHNRKKVVINHLLPIYFENIQNTLACDVNISLLRWSCELTFTVYIHHASNTVTLKCFAKTFNRHQKPDLF